MLARPARGRLHAARATRGARTRAVRRAVSLAADAARWEALRRRIARKGAERSRSARRVNEPSLAKADGVA